MSWDEDPFDDDEERRKAFRRWFGEFVPESMFKELEEMMDHMMKQFGNGSFIDPRKMEEFMNNPRGTNPFVFGFSMQMGPDGKPVIRRFGNTSVGEGPVMGPTLEPLVDILEEDGEIIVVAELPGVDKDDIKVRIKGQQLTIEVTDPNKPYHKELELPSRVEKDEATSSIRNGVLEVRLKKK